MLIHELRVGLRHDLESFMHRLFSRKERGAEVQCALLLAETASRHKHNARLIQNLVGGGESVMMQSATAENKATTCQKHIIH